MSCYNFLSKFLNLKVEPSESVDTGQETTVVEMPTSDSETILALKRLLSDKIEELKLREETITLLEKELDDKDAQIFYLKNEIDKFRQVVKPLTQKIITKQITLDDDLKETKICLAPTNEPRIKRQAISAEPLQHYGHEIVKIPKCVRYV